MLRNYFKIALRILSKNRIFSFINICGLALSMSVCLLLIALIADQRSYDQFHTNKDRIYRVISDRTGGNPSSFATTPARLADTLKEDGPGVEAVLQLYNFSGNATYDQTMLPLRGAAASANFFDVFDFRLLEGSRQTVLSEPYSIVLTEDTAVAFFGAEDPLGKVLSFEQFGDFVVTGITENPPYNSHLTYDMLLSYSTLALLEGDGKMPRFSERWDFTDEHFTYVLLEEGADAKALLPYLDLVSQVNYANPAEYALHFRLQPLTGITLDELLENQIKFAMPAFFVYFLILLALLVMISAGFNYTNLSLARALSRAREVGIRKVAGASRRQLFSQFLGEAVLLSFLAFILALVLNEMFVLPGFQSLAVINQLGLEVRTSPSAYLFSFLFCVTVGIAAGTLPAVYLSAYEPARVLKGLVNLRLSGLTLRRVMIVAQFVISLVFIISVITIFQQFRFMMNADYGFNQANIINVNLQGRNYQTAMAELGRHSSIQSISASSLVPGTGSNQATVARRSIEDQVSDVYQISVDPNFIANLELTLIAGSNFPQSLGTTQERYVILNETAVRAYGYGTPLEAIGQTLLVDREGVPVEILGVVKDFHYRDMTSPIEPFVLRYLPARFRFLNLRVQSNDMLETIAFITAAWNNIDPALPVNYAFFDQQIADNYAIFTDLLKIVGLISLLSIVIACLGLLGIAALSVEMRIKEIGIRKVLGTTDWALLALLSRGFLGLMGLAIIIAMPVAWILNNFVLQNFAYRIDSPVVGMIAGIMIMLGLGCITIVSQTVKGVVTPPTELLRYE